MRYLTKILIALCLSLLVSANIAQAKLIVESANKVLGKQIYEPGFGHSRAKNHSPSVTYQDKNSENYRYNYNNNDDVVVNEEPQQSLPQNDIKLVDLRRYTTFLVLTEGQYLAVRLDEVSGEKWNFENRGSSLEFVKSEKRNDIVILLFRAKSLGNSRINFDKLKGNIAVSTKVLQVKVL